ncbi:MAG: hypothetical protein ACKVOU_09465 [Cytophagales bacterium]
MPNLHRTLFTNLNNYKRKYYLNRVLKGVIFLFALLLAAFLLFATLEFYGNFNTYFRTVFFFSFISLVLIFGIYWIGEPLYRIFNLNKHFSDEDAAKQIGDLIPDVRDKLLNTLQLSKLSETENTLVLAGIAQKTQQLSVFNFADVIKIDANKKYLPYALVPLFIVVALLIFIPRFLTDTTNRIVLFQQDFIPEAPFKFIFNSKEIEAFKNDDIEVKLTLVGNSIPETSYILINGLRNKMERIDETHFSYFFRKIDQPINFNFEAAGFTSQNYQIDLKTRPILNSFAVRLNFPSYLRKKNEILSNTGNLLIPEGTNISWQFDTEDCEKLVLTTGENSQSAAKNFLGSGFEITKQFKKSTSYALQLFNSFGKSKEKMEYSVTVIPDEYPKISIEQFKDTTLFNFLIVGGNLADDYGLTELKLFYRKNTMPSYSFTSDFVEQPQKQPFKPIDIAINNKQNNQSFYFRWDIDSLHLLPGESLEYYLKVWDNDGINGRKNTQTQSFELKLPTKKEIEDAIKESSVSAEKQINTTLQKAESLKKEVKKLEQRLKGKKILDWQDKKALEDLLKNQQSLQNEVEQLQEKHKDLSEKKDRFDKTNERLAEKTKLLQQLMNEMLDEETKKLYQELAKLLEEKNKENEIKELVEKLSKKDQNIEKELDRALEMFKQLKFETKLEDVQQKLEELAQKQDQLASKTEEKSPEQAKLKEEQEKLNSEFGDMKKELEELKKMNEELENKSELEDTKQKEDEISQEQEKSSDQIDKKENKKAAKSQKNAAQKMQQMAQKMKEMQQSMESKQMDENAQDLRAILENLLRLSYDQEDVMREFKNVAQSDPRYVPLSQRQLKLKDDSKIIEDSLNALAKRVFQIQSFITKELLAMNEKMDESAVAIRARRADMAAGKQQMAMTSMNNLALLLGDVLKQMQDQMQEQKQGGKSGGKPKKNKGKGKGDSPSMSQLQKNLNKKIEELKGSGKQGRELSEELSKLARQQEQIRKSMNQEGGKEGGNGTGDANGKDGKEEKERNGKDGKEQGKAQMEQLKREMEQTENDLVNKKLTQEMLNRQQNILNRLLEHEKAQREREQDPKRESQIAKEKPRRIPASFEQYIKDKEKQVELLRSIPPSLNPYYKRETNEYFEKINQ